MSLADLVRLLARKELPDMAIDALPYAQHLGLQAGVENDILTLHMPYKLDLIGNPHPQRLHGGVIGGMLETCGALTVARLLAQNAEDIALISMPKPINITLDYLRAGAPEDVFARAYVMRIGRRVANVRAEAWQGERERLITTAHMNVLVS